MGSTVKPLIVGNSHMPEEGILSFRSSGILSISGALLADALNRNPVLVAAITDHLRG